MFGLGLNAVVVGAGDVDGVVAVDVRVDVVVDVDDVAAVDADVC